MADGYLLKPETAEGLLGLLRNNSGKSRLGNDHAGIMGRIEHVKCVSLISSSPFPHYLATVELISDLTTATSSTGNVVLASLAQGALTTGRTYNGVLSGGKVVSGQTLPIYWCDPGSGSGPIYARITGRSGGYYAFEQVTRTAGGVFAVVSTGSGGIAGTTSSGYAQDIGGIANDVLINQVFLLVPNPTVPGTWLFGPVALCS